MKKIKSIYTASFKSRIVIEALNEQETLNELAHKHKIIYSLIYNFTKFCISLQETYKDMRTLDIPGYTVEALQEIAKSNPDYQVGIRLLALIQIKKGLPSRKLEDIFQVSHTRYCQWVKSFNKDGIEGLKNKPKSGRRPKLNQQQLERLKDNVLNTSPMAHGFNTATWNGPLIREFIKQDMGVDFKKAQVYNILKGQGLTYQKAKGKYPEADAALKEEMSKEIKKNTRRT